METTDIADDQSVPIPGVARPDTVRAKARVGQATVAVRPNLWHNWTRIAIRSEARAIAAHEKGLATGDIGAALEGETLESMVTVSATRHAFHHLYLDWYERLGLAAHDEESKVPLLATTDVPDEPDERREWLGALREVVAHRDEIIHIAQASQPAVAHPLGTNTSELDARFTAERATRAVDLMLDFYRRVVESPSPALTDWGSKNGHVVSYFDEMRRKRSEIEAGIS